VPVSIDPEPPALPTPDLVVIGLAGNVNASMQKSASKVLDSRQVSTLRVA
jgi:hypothetical protein